MKPVVTIELPVMALVFVPLLLAWVLLSRVVWAEEIRRRRSRHKVEFVFRFDSGSMVTSLGKAQRAMANLARARLSMPDE